MLSRRQDRRIHRWGWATAAIASFSALYLVWPADPDPPDTSAGSDATSWRSVEPMRTTPRPTDAKPARTQPAIEIRTTDPSAIAFDAKIDRPTHPQAESPQPPALPDWIGELLPSSEDDPREHLTNEDPEALAGRATGLNPNHLRVLREIIELNGLDEDSTPFDSNDGDGRLSALELGFQVWRDGELILLSFGADPQSSYLYDLTELPESLAELDRLELLDVHGNSLALLPDSIGDLRTLEVLRAHRNDLSELPNSISGLQNLRELIATQNELRVLPRHIRGLEALERLFVGDNPLEEFPYQIAYLRNLREFGAEVANPTPDTLLDDSAWPDAGAISPLCELSQIETLYLSGRVACEDSALRSQLEDCSIRVVGLSNQPCNAGS